MVVGIRGQSGAGKSTLAMMLCYMFNNTGTPNMFEFLAFQAEAKHGYIKGKWRLANFSSTLKVAMATLYGIDYKEYEDQNFKDTLIGTTVWQVGVYLRQIGEEDKFVPISSHESEEKATDALLDLLARAGNDDVRYDCRSKELTWRDTLNLGSEGLHLHLGTDITFQAYQHRFSSPTEHLIMADLRKPKEIDLIKENGGVVIWIKRNFVYPVSIKEAHSYFYENGTIMTLADGNNPVEVTDPEEFHALLEADIPFGISAAPKYNVADTWLDGDDRADFVVVNPSGNPKHKETYTALFEEALNIYDSILTKLLTQHV